MTRMGGESLAVRPLAADQVRVSLGIEDAQGFVHHYDDIVTSTEAVTGALRLLAHMEVRNVLA